MSKRMLFRRWMAVLSAVATVLAACTGTAWTATCTPSGATLQYNGDDAIGFYINGTQIGAATTLTVNGSPVPMSCLDYCGGMNTCGISPTYVLSPADLALLNPSGENILGVYNTDQCGGNSLATWDLRITYSDCATQDITSNGVCTKVFYSGSLTGNPQYPFFPAGWAAIGYDDSAWGGVYASYDVPPGGYATASLTDSGGATIPWIWGTNSFISVNQGDGYLFRQYFALGDPGACTFAPLATPTPIGAATGTPTATSTPTAAPAYTATPCGYPGDTCTPTPDARLVDVFYVSENLYRPASSQPVSLFVEYSRYPGEYSLKVFNTAGEMVKALAPTRQLDAPVSESYTWDGTNQFGGPCASGIYLFRLDEPFDRKTKKVLLLR